MGVIQIGNVHIDYTMPNLLGMNATIQRDDAGSKPNWDQIPGLPTTFPCTKIVPSESIAVRSGVVVACPVQHRNELLNIEIGFVQSVTFSNRAAAYPIPAGGGTARKFFETLDCPVKDGEGDPWYQDYEPSLLCWDEDDVGGWTGSTAKVVKLSDRPSFSFPTEFRLNDTDVAVQEAAHNEEFLVALAVKDLRTDTIHYLFTVAWRLRAVISGGALMNLGGYEHLGTAEIAVPLRNAKPAEIVLDGLSANRSSRTQVATIPM